MICNDVENPSISLSQTRRDEAFKLYLADTGLFTTLLFNDEMSANEDIYRKLLSDKLPENLGYLYENAAAQILAASGKKLYYHTWDYGENNHFYEIDFLITEKTKISPIEIKSSAITRHKSMDVFSEKYSRVIQNKYLFSAHDIAKDGDLQIWPMYCMPAVVS